MEGIADPLGAPVAGATVGGDRFADRMRRAPSGLSENGNVRRESGQRRQLASWCALGRVVAAVAWEYAREEPVAT